MPRSVLLAIPLLAALTPGSLASTIREIRVEGNVRIPASTILHHARAAGARPGGRLDASAARAAIDRLRATGAFDSVEIETEERGGDRVDLLLRVGERPLVAAFELRTPRFEREITELLRRDRLEPRPATPFDPARARRSAAKIRTFLEEHGFPNAECSVAVERVGANVKVGLEVRPGARISVAAVTFEGNASIPARELLRQMRSAPRRLRDLPRRALRMLLEHGAPRPPQPTGTYVRAELDRDLGRLRDLYRERGFAAARAGPARVDAIGGEVRITVAIDEGPEFRLAAVDVAADGKQGEDAARAPVARLAAPRPYRSRELEAARREIAASLARSGCALAEVRLDETIDRARGEVRALYRVHAGAAFDVGAIRFEGSGRVRDRFLRRDVRLLEGERFDASKLASSVARLGRSGAIEPLAEADVTLDADPGSGTVDVVLRVREAKRQGIYGTGGTLGGGHLGVLYRAFDLLGLGERLAVEIDGGSTRSNFLFDLAVRHFLGSPALVGLALIHRYARVDVAGIVPDARDLVPVFRRRAWGASAGTSFPVTARANLGVTFDIERETSAESESSSARTSTRSETAASFALDATRADRGVLSGSRLAASQAWLVSGGAVEAARPSLRFEAFAPSPWRRRDGLAFAARGSALVPLAGRIVPIERRYFPGEEAVRGFGRGALSPWVELAGSPATLRPTGADAFGSVSAEYRAPIHGAFGAAAFVDLGVARVSRRAAEQSAPAARLLDATTGLPRLSVGGELRLDLPLIRQPARLIFAWNPLRLDRILSTAASEPLRLADPRGAVRFALGGIF